MKSLFLTMALLLGLRASATIDRTSDKTFSVQLGGNLHVENSGGNIRVTSSSTNQLTVTAHEHFHAKSEKEADEIASHLSLKIEQNADGVSAIAKYDGFRLNSFFFWHNGDAVNVDFVISVPSKYNLNVQTSGGDVAIGDIQGQVDADTSGGQVRLGTIDGVVNAHSSGGDVIIADASKDIKLSTSGGNVEAGSIGGSADLETSGGNIVVKSCNGAVKAHTSGGNVRVTFATALTKGSSLSTSGGDVSVKIPADKGIRLDAETSGGEVKTEGLSLVLESGKVGTDSLKATLAGGGPNLILRTSGGNINIEAN